MASAISPPHPDDVAAITTDLEAVSLDHLGRKVFVGNLSFTTQESHLRELFSSHGQITDAQIIFRGTRSLGYGFVTFESTHQADAAVAATNKSSLDGRIINVEIARPTPPPKAQKTRDSEEKKSPDEDQDHGADNPSGSRGASRPRRGRGRGRGRGGRLGRFRRPPKAQSETNGADDPGATTDASAPPEGDASQKVSPQRTRAKRGRGRPRGESRPRRVGPPEGPPSKTLLFIANLPFGLSDEGLKDFFSAYPVVTAHVVRRRYGSMSGKSKGFGFVEFENEEAQLKAMAENQGKQVEGRGLQIKVAISEVKKEDALANQSPESASEFRKEDAGVNGRGETAGEAKAVEAGEK